MKRSLLSLLTLLLLFFCFFYDASFGSDNLSEDLTAVNIQIDYLRQRVRESNNRVKQLENAMARKRREINDLNSQIAQLHKQQKDIEKQVLKLIEDIETQKDELQLLLKTYRSRLVQLHRIRQSTLLGSIFSAQNLNSFLNRFEMVKYLLENDKELIDSLTNRIEKQQKAYKELQRKQSQAKAVANELNNNQKKLEKENSSFQSLHSTITLERKLFLDREKRLEAARKEIEKKISQIEKQQDQSSIEKELAAEPTIKPRAENALPDSAPKAAQVMRFSWPVAAANISEYEQTGTENTISLQIRNSAETTIQAAGRGKVIYRGSIAGLGNVLIIAHGRSFSTVYGHLDEIWVGLGEVVEQRQAIGLKSSLRNQRIHFEIRFGGRRQPPLDFLPASN